MAFETTTTGNIVSHLLTRETGARSHTFKKYPQYESLHKHFFPGLHRNVPWVLSEAQWKERYDEKCKHRFGSAKNEFIQLILAKANIATLTACIERKRKEDPTHLLSKLLPLNFLKEADPFSSPLFEEHPAYFAQIRDLLWGLIEEFRSSYPLTAFHEDVDLFDEIFWYALCTRQSSERLSQIITLTDDFNPNPELTNDLFFHPIHFACWSGNANAVRCLIRHGALMNHPISEDWTEMHFAAQNGSVAVVEFLREQGSNLAVQNDKQDTPALIACEYGHLEVAKRLPFGGSYEAMSGAIRAFRRGHLHVVEYLQKQARKVFLNSWHYVDALNSGNIQPFQFLLALGIPLLPINSLLKEGIEAPFGKHQCHVLKFLFHHLEHTQPHEKQRVVNHCLQAAVMHEQASDEECLKLFLDHGAHIHQLFKGYPLIVAISIKFDAASVIFLLRESIKRMPLEPNKAWDDYWRMLSIHFISVIQEPTKQLHDPELLLLCALRLGVAPGDIEKIIRLNKANVQKAEEKYGCNIRKLCEVFNQNALPVLQKYWPRPPAVTPPQRTASSDGTPVVSTRHVWPRFYVAEPTEIDAPKDAERPRKQLKLTTRHSDS